MLPQDLAPNLVVAETDGDQVALLKVGQIATDGTVTAQVVYPVPGRDLVVTRTEHEVADWRPVTDDEYNAYLTAYTHP